MAASSSMTAVNGLIADINALQCVIRRLARLGDDQRDAFADETNPVDRHHRPVRHDRARHDQFGLMLAILPERSPPARARRTPAPAQAAERF